jgi:hypothetical protein
VSIKLVGIKDVDRKLKRMESKDARKAARAGVGASLTVYGKAIRREIGAEAGASQRLKRALKKTIGRKAKRGRRTGYEAKTGLGVGKRKPIAGGRAKGAGVGVSKQNVHWFALGTKDRTQKSTGRSTGALKPIGAVRRAIISSRSAALKALRTATLKKIDQLTRKG